MLPATIALVDDDPEFSQYLAQHLSSEGVSVQVFADSNLLLVSPNAYQFDFYVLDLSLPGVDGVELIRILRLRTKAGILVVSGRLSPDVFQSVVRAGADMYLAKPVQFEQVSLAIEAVHRRSSSPAGPDAMWVLDRKSADLVAPDGSRVGLSEADLALLSCFVKAQGAVVPRETLLQGLGRNPDDGDNDPLNATIFRLRRRIERATPLAVPLHSKSRVGYAFRAPLKELS
ncbi:response regulator transcription factor [Inhella crocodyli]|jgi:DNA-binding response OmpR family regulator|uniref:Response regulator transcription factor n=1 Tax=Inhella crocodyli TaxID=2499851 RepID=A0A3S2Y000_9BURK|nr:response regulator transcription factor [Inhella crocodyli]RVT88693.1 response regulator transcription factor [Inhella crocodyli]